MCYRLLQRGGFEKWAQDNLVKNTCDFCGEKQIFPNQLQPADGDRLAFWITLVRMFKVKDQMVPVQKHACKDSCAANIISTGMLDLPKEIKEMLADEERRNLDLQKKLNEKFAGLSLDELGSGPAPELPTPAGEA
jgi:hypothetical protein